MNTSDRGLQLIREFEGFCGHPYNDVAGHCTVGYGHLLHRGPCCGTEQPVTRERAEEILRADVRDKSEAAIAYDVRVPLTQSQYDALASFIFNVGSENFLTSHLLRYLNTGGYAAAAAEFDRWNHAGGVVVDDLTRRRARERALFEEASNGVDLQS